MRTYLVTGGLGSLGAPLVRALVTSGHRVRVLDNASRGSVARLGDLARDVEVLTADVRDPEAVLEAARGIDSVCHLAFVNGTRHFYERPAFVLEVGVRGMLNILDACLRQKIGELILASSSEVYQTAPSVPTDESVPFSIPDPYNPRFSYAGAKIISELLAINYGRAYLERVVIFRPHNVYGPDMGWDHVIPQFVRRLLCLRSASRSEETPFQVQGTGGESRSFIYIEDFVRSVMLLIEHGRHLNVYNVGTTEEVQIADLAQRVARCLGMRIRVVAGPTAPGSTSRRCPDIRKLESLGFCSQYRLDEGLQPTVAWYGAHPAPDHAEAVVKANTVAGSGK